MGLDLESLDHVGERLEERGLFPVSSLGEHVFKLEPRSYGEQNRSVPILRLYPSRRIIAYLNNVLCRLKLALSVLSEASFLVIFCSSSLFFLF